MSGPCPFPLRICGLKWEDLVIKFVIGGSIIKSWGFRSYHGLEIEVAKEGLRAGTGKFLATWWFISLIV